MITKIDHVNLTIPVGESEKAREFYTQVLGLKEIPRPQALLEEEGLWFSVGSLQLHISVEESINRGSLRSKAHVAFEVSEMQRIKEKLQNAGVQIRASRKINAYDRVKFRDPFGNRIELMMASKKETP